MIDWLSFNVVFQLYLQTVNNVRKKDDTEVVQTAKVLIALSKEDIKVKVSTEERGYKGQG